MSEDLEIVYRDPRPLKGHPKNARTHSEEQVRQIRRSIDEFGFVNPILLRDDSKSIGAGHGRQAASLLDPVLDRVPTITKRGLSDAQWEALILADNKIAANAGWNEDLLRDVLGSLSGIGFDLSLTGFDALELGEMFQSPKEPVDLDEVPDVPAEPVSILGDLWTCGRHRILCADSLDIERVRRLLNGITPDLANCDAPYGINIVKGATDGGPKAFGSKRTKVQAYGNGGAPYGGWKDGDSRTQKPKRGTVGAANIIRAGFYDAIIGDDTTDTAVGAYRILTEIGVPIIALWGGNYFADHLPPSRCWLIWDKETNGNFGDGELAWTNQDKRIRILRHQWSGLIKASERNQKRVHPTQKPVALAEWVADTIAPKATTVLDLFLGSASTLIAAENRGLTCFGMELSPAYIDVAISRWEKVSGLKATLSQTGETFAEVRERRGSVDVV